MAQPNLVAIVKQNTLCIFVKSEKRTPDGKVIQSEIYNIRKGDETLGIGRESFTREEYNFLFDDRTSELLVSHPVDGKNKLKSLGLVEYKKEVNAEAKKSNEETKSIIEYLIS